MLQHLNSTNVVRRAAQIALATLAILLLTALYFWQERVMFYDANFIVFRIINQGILQLQEHRYGSFITQIGPLIATKMGLPLKAILIIYTLSFPLFFLITGLLLYRWKAYPLVILLACYYTLFVAGTFYWTNNEVHQGQSWLLLWLGFIWLSAEKKYPPAPVLLVSMVLIFMAVFTHPLVIISGVFLWVFLLLDGRLKTLPVWLLIALSLVLVITVIARQQISMMGGYDTSKMEQVVHAGIKDIIAAFKNETSRAILNKILFNFWLFPLLLISGLVVLIQQKRWWQFGWTLLSLLGLYAMICLSFPNYTAFHTDSEWMTFSLIGATPFVFYVLPLLKPLRATLLIAMVFFIRLVYIGMAAPEFVARQKGIQELVQQLKLKQWNKVALLPDDVQLGMDGLLPWGLPMETITRSALNGDTIQVSAIIADDNDRQRVLDLNSHQLAGPWEYYEQGDLNPRYFRIDTTQRYQVKSVEEVMQP